MANAFSGELTVPVSVGEIADKITILRIKRARIEDSAKRVNVLAELAALDAIFSGAFPHLSADATAKIDRLQSINERLWEIEDDIRLCERDGDFGAKFIALARSVYVTNDERARVKKDINLLLGSKYIEEKSYAGS
ncbi:hypothetical protein M2322_002267 [Rhodoblastus acidophilus]|uniref:DUF6165 family protein n=1 Tax=Rhodoblastus acidophilus TaxID=1074 RepID=UPI002225047B|nr:DUF6165 family protein [Rhodoblastus acidophilus]MCW2316719.1 hypothetical protein [Rhodoblastus acidophilus]